VIHDLFLMSFLVFRLDRPMRHSQLSRYENIFFYYYCFKLFIMIYQIDVEDVGMVIAGAMMIAVAEVYST